MSERNDLIWEDERTGLLQDIRGDLLRAKADIMRQFDVFDEQYTSADIADIDNAEVRAVIEQYTPRKKYAEFAAAMEECDKKLEDKKLRWKEREEIRRKIDSLKEGLALCGRIDAIDSRISLYDLALGKTRDVTFGAVYREDAWEPLHWICAESDGERALLVAKSVVAWLPLHKAAEKVSWPQSALFEWLNGRFLAECMTEGERELMQTVTDKASGKEEKAFILSEEEARKYLADGLAADDRWWLRPEAEGETAPTVETDGTVSEAGSGVETVCGVRPALYVSLKMLAE